MDFYDIAELNTIWHDLEIGASSVKIDSAFIELSIVQVRYEVQG